MLNNNNFLIHFNPIIYYLFFFFLISNIYDFDFLLSVRLVCAAMSPVFAFSNFFFLFKPAPIALFMGHEQCNQAYKP